MLCLNALFIKINLLHIIVNFTVFRDSEIKHFYSFYFFNISDPERISIKIDSHKMIAFISDLSVTDIGNDYWPKNIVTLD